MSGASLKEKYEYLCYASTEWADVFTIDKWLLVAYIHYFIINTDFIHVKLSAGFLIEQRTDDYFSFLCLFLFIVHFTFVRCCRNRNLDDLIEKKI